MRSSALARHIAQVVVPLAIARRLAFEDSMNPWQWWQDKRAGKPVEINEGTPHAGFYRWPRREGGYLSRRTFTPVAYYPGQNGELVCRIGNEDVTPERGCDIWIYVADNDVDEEPWRAVSERSEPWPDEHPAVPMGHNLPPQDDSYDGLKATVEDLAHEANKHLEGPPIKTQAEADQIANLADRLAELHNKINDARHTEKKVHDEAAKTVQQKWAPLLALAFTYKKLKDQVLLPWYKLEERRVKAEAEAAAEAGEAEAAEPRRLRAGTRGRAMSLRTRKRAEIVDY